MIPFNKIVTIYHMTKTTNGIIWNKTIYDRVYYSISKRMTISNNEHSYVNAHIVVIPYEVDVEVGDVCRIGSCDIKLSLNDSPKEVLRNGGWVIQSCDKNIYPDCSLSHISLSDV